MAATDMEEAADGKAADGEVGEEDSDGGWVCGGGWGAIATTDGDEAVDGERQQRRMGMRRRMGRPC